MALLTFLIITIPSFFDISLSRYDTKRNARQKDNAKIYPCQAQLKEKYDRISYDNNEGEASVNKPYITLKVFITNILGVALAFISLIICIVKGDYSILPLPITMLFSVIIVSLVLHFLPVSFWNLPIRKLNEKNALLVYEDTAFMLALIDLLLGLMTFLMTLNFASELAMTIISLSIMVAIALLMIWSIRKIKKDNER